MEKTLDIIINNADVLSQVVMVAGALTLALTILAAMMFYSMHKKKVNTSKKEADSTENDDSNKKDTKKKSLSPDKVINRSIEGAGDASTKFWKNASKMSQNSINKLNKKIQKKLQEQTETRDKKED
jgi:hypothetical protein